jgi:hypothetical protein
MKSLDEIKNEYYLIPGPTLRVLLICARDGKENKEVFEGMLREATTLKESPYYKEEQP